MITAIVQFQLTTITSIESAREAFSKTAPSYRNVKGLIRKYYLLSEDGKTGGGVYLWNSREDAELFYNESWHAMIREKYSAEPQITYYASPVIVDNLSQTITGAV